MDALHIFTLSGGATLPIWPVVFGSVFLEDGSYSGRASIFTFMHTIEKKSGTDGYPGMSDVTMRKRPGRNFGKGLGMGRSSEGSLRSGLTLAEILVMTVIITIMASLVFPVDPTATAT
jgi:hypothetical protein